MIVMDTMITVLFVLAVGFLASVPGAIAYRRFKRTEINSYATDTNAERRWSQAIALEADLETRMAKLLARIDSLETENAVLQTRITSLEESLSETRAKAALYDQRLIGYKRVAKILHSQLLANNIPPNADISGLDGF